MAKKYRDEIAMVCHDMMKAAQTVGGVTDAEMADFEKGCFIDNAGCDSTREREGYQAPMQLRSCELAVNNEQ